VEVTAHPDPHYHFVGWTGAGTNLITVGDVNGATVTVTMSGPVELTANFAIDRHTFEVVSAHDAPQPAVGLYTNAYGTTIGNTVNGVDTLGATQYVATGWALAGVTSTGGLAAGANTNVVLVLTNDAVLTWGWGTNYWLDTTAGTNGSVAPGDGWMAAESNVVVTATPDAHYHFIGWTGAGTNLITGGDVNSPTVTVTMTGPVELTASFAIDRHTFEVVSAYGTPQPAVGLYTNAYGTSIGNTVNGADTVGTTQYVATGWTLAGATDTGGNAAGTDTNVVVALTNDAVFTWGWGTNYWLDTTAGANGNVTPEQGWFAAESNVVVTAIPDANYRFVGWTGAGTNLITAGDANSATVTVTLTQPTELTAVFAIGHHTTEIVSVYDSPDPAVGVYTNAYGTPLEAAVARYDERNTTQYVCTGWTLVGQADTNGFTSGAETNVSLVVTNDAVLTWGWGTNYWFEMTVGPNGDVTPGDGWLAAESNVVVTATPDPHYHFTGWTGAGTNLIVAGDVNSPTVTVSMTGPVVLAAGFAIDLHTFEVVCAHDSPDPAAGVYTNSYGTTIGNSVNAVNTLGGTQYVCTGWTLAGVTSTGGVSAGADTNVVVTLTNNAVLTWGWTTNYWVDTTAGANGSVVPGDGWLAAGSNVVVTAIPDAHHHFTGWTGAGTNLIVVGDVNAPTVTVSMTGPVALAASFAIDRHATELVCAHDSPEPAPGVYTNAWGTPFEAVVARYDEQGTTQYVCTGWTLAGQTDTNGFTAGADTNVSLTVTNDAVLTWGWQTNYWFDTAAGPNGSVAPGDDWKPADSNVVVTAIPDAHRHFTGWTGAGTNLIVAGDAGSPAITVSMTGPVSLTAHFAIDRHTTELVCAHDSPDPAGGVYTNAYGTPFESSVDPVDLQNTTQYVCTGWTLVGQADTNGATSGPGTNVSLVVTNDSVLTWGWQTNYWMDTAAGPNGRVIPGDGWVEANWMVFVVATPDSHYHFTRWTGSGTNFIQGDGDPDATVLLSMQEPLSLTAHFAIDKHTFEVASAHGAPQPAVGIYTNAYGTSIGNTVNGVNTVGTTQYVATGWTLAGVTDIGGNAAGTDTNVVLTLTNDAVLTWGWRTNYWLDTAATGSGSVGPEDAWVSAGSNVVVTATPDAHHHFTGWTGSGTNLITVGDANSPTVTVTMTAGADLAAHFAIDRHTFEVVSAHGAPQPAVGIYTNAYGTTIGNTVNGVDTLGATQYVATGWTLAGVTDTGGNAAGVNTNVVLTLTNNAVLTWGWRTNYWLDTAATGSGSVDRQDGWIGAGSNVVVTATPAAHHHFTGWTGPGTNLIVVGDANSRTVTVAMSGPVELTGHFAIDEHTFEVVSAHGAPGPTVGLYTNAYGTTIGNTVNGVNTVGATQYVATGWTLAGVTDTGGNAAGVNTNVVLTLTNNAVLTWTWHTNYWLDTDTAGNGNVIPTNAWYGAGSNVVVQAVPDPHYHFTHWSVYGTNDISFVNGDGSTIEVAMTAPIRLVANFAIDRHTLTIVSEHDAPVPPPGPVSLTYGSPLSAAVSPVDTQGTTQFVSTGWALAGLTDTNGFVSGSDTNVSLVVTNDGVLTWTWTTNYWLDTTAGANGSVAPSNAWVSAGSNAVVEATPDAHHHFAGWTGPGTNLITVGNANSATITVEVTAPVALTANFALDRHTLEVVSAHGTPLPAVGSYTNFYGTTIGNTVDGVNTVGSTQYVSTGWTLAGVTSTGGMAAGANTNVVLTLTNDAVLTWGWRTNYWLNTATAGNGSVDPGDGWVSAGSNIVVKATPDAHHHFTGWTGSGTNLIAVGDVTGATVTVAATAPVALTANFALDAHTLEVVSAHGSPEPTVGLYTNAYATTISNSVNGINTLGSTQYISTGWALAGVTATGGAAFGSETNVVLTLTNDAVLTWGWRTNYWLDTVAGPNGSVGPDDGWIASGSNVVVSAASDANHHFAGWTGSGTNLITVGSAGSATVTVTVTDGATLVANFAIDTYELEITSRHGSPTPAAGVHTNAYGTFLTNLVNAAEVSGGTQYVATGWVLSGATDTNGLSAGPETNMCMAVTNDATLAWGWQTNYLLSAVGSGSGRVAPENQWVQSGWSVAVTALADPHHHFTGWSGPGTNLIAFNTPADETIIVAMTAAADLVAHFEPDPHTFEVVSAHGAPLPAVGSYTNLYGTTVSNTVNGVDTLGATQYVATGWALAGVTSTGGLAAGANTNVVLVLTNDAVLTWGWSTNYRLDAAVAGNGSVAPSNAWVGAGSNVVVEATPDAHHHFTGWTGPGTNLITVGNASSATVTVEVTAPVALTANFDEDVPETFEIVGIVSMTGSDGVSLSWRSESPHLMFSVDVATNLISGAFVPLASNLPATPPTTVFIDNVERAGPVFYRIRIRP